LNKRFDNAGDRLVIIQDEPTSVSKGSTSAGQLQ
jgi:hypothetical protein